MRKGTQTFVDSNEIESGNNTDSPLVLDLDGTLLRTNLLLETMLAYVKANPLHLINILLWLWKYELI